MSKKFVTIHRARARPNDAVGQANGLAGREAAPRTGRRRGQDEDKR
jgi:hypothetical protein